VGNFCSIAADVTILLGGNHRHDWVTTYPFSAFGDRWPEAAGIAGHPSTNGDVVLGHDAWVGAGAVVRGDIPPYAIAIGNPATVVRHRFDGTTVDALLRLRWWDWDDARIRRHLPLLLSGRVHELLARSGPGDPAP
jgi:acetyltransferase-like isoleucine patch superfamily enzyme